MAATVGHAGVGRFVPQGVQHLLSLIDADDSVTSSRQRDCHAARPCRDVQNPRLRHEGRGTDECCQRRVRQQRRSTVVVAVGVGREEIAVPSHEVQLLLRSASLSSTGNRPACGAPVTTICDSDVGPGIICLNMVICLLQANTVSEAILIKQALRALEGRLPPGWTQRVLASSSTASVRLDGTIEIASPDGVKARVVVEAKNRLFPRDVRPLKSRLTQDGSGPYLVVAPFLTPTTRRSLREENVNYVDTTGNVRLVLERPGVYLEAVGADVDPFPSDEPRRSLRGPKAGRIVRALCDFPAPLSISDLAAKSGVDVSYASRMVDWLAREALLTRAPRGPVQAVRQAELIRRWAEDYEVLKSNDARSFLDPRGLENFAKRLRDSPSRYAVTGSMAAARIAPIAPSRLAMVYVDDPDSAASALNLRAVDTGANVMLLGPFDPVVFERTWKDRSTTFVAPSQAAVDLLTGPGRAPAEAEAILEWMAAGRRK